MGLKTVLEALKNRSDTAEFLIRSQTEHNGQKKEADGRDQLYYYFRKLWHMLVIDYYTAEKDASLKTLIAKLMCCELNSSCIFSKFSVR